MVVFKNNATNVAKIRHIIGVMCAVAWFPSTFALGRHVIALIRMHSLDMSRIVVYIIPNFIFSIIVLPLIFFWFKSCPKEIIFAEGESYLIVKNYFFRSQKIMKKSGKIIFYLPTLFHGLTTVVFIKRYGFLLINKNAYDSAELLLSLLVVWDYL